MIERVGFQPLKIHKNLAIRALREHPEDFRKIIASDEFSTAEEAIAAMEEHPAEWIVNGTLGGDESE